MNRFVKSVHVVAATFVLGGFPAYGVANEEEVSEAAPAIEDLGDERYRIGTITIDKAARKFTLGGKVLHLTQPLEYLAVKTEGYKGYESLLELETSAVDFQLACILIGLDDEDSVKPRFQFDERETEGQAVEITISWEVDGALKTTSAANAMTAGDGAFTDAGWVYVGSRPSPQDGSLLAEMSGTLIGFVHDPLSIIEHRTGARAGSYGMVKGNSELLPPEGSPITLTVLVVTD
jgi:hypothetical protein